MSMVARLNSVSLSARALGWRFFSSSLARMNASIGVLTQALFFTAGTGCFFTGWKAQ